MNITDLLLGDSGNNTSIATLAKVFGLDDKAARSVIGSLAPALSAGLGHHAKTDQGKSSILDALSNGNHNRYIDSPELLGQLKTEDEGNSILRHIFGTKDVSRHAAERAAKSSGLNIALIKKMLPVVAIMVMGSLGKRLLGGSGDENINRLRSSSLLSSLLDSNNDDSMLDDVLGLRFKTFFK
jgi:hypothetical protein